MTEKQNNENKMLGSFEAILFVSTDIVKVSLLSRIFNCEEHVVLDLLNKLKNKYEQQNCGIILKEVAGGWRMFSNPIHHEIIEKYLLTLDPRKLSAAALETLSIIVYCQPVTRAGVASIRGVNSDSSINSLVEKGLICEAGMSKNANNAILYKTTSKFLENYGLNSLDDLPKIEDFAPDTETKNFIFERLGSVKEYEYFTTKNKEENLKQMTFLDEEENKQSDNNSCQNENTNFAEYQPGETPKELFSQALSEAFGVTEKVDLDKLKLNIDE